MDVKGEVKLLLKLKKKWGGGGEGWVGGRGVRVDVIREVKLFVKIENKNI